MRPSSGKKILFTVHSYPRSIHLIQDQESVFSLSAINPIDPPNQTLEESFRSPTAHLYHYPKRVQNQINN